MRNYQLTAYQSLDFSADLEIRIVDESFDSELESSSIRVYADSNRLFADFAASIKVFNVDNADESVLVNVDHKRIDLMRVLESNEIIACSDFMEIAEFQTRNSDRLEVLQEIADHQTLVELQISVK